MKPKLAENPITNEKIQKSKAYFLKHEGVVTDYTYVIDHIYIQRIQKIKNFLKDTPNSLGDYNYYKLDLNKILNYFNENLTIEKLKEHTNNRIKMFVCDYFNTVERLVNEKIENRIESSNN